MAIISPNPEPWDALHKQLVHYARTNSCVPPSPPRPLILAGWVYSNDLEKKRRWEETTQWASENGCSELIGIISDDDYYFG